MRERGKKTKRKRNRGGISEPIASSWCGGIGTGISAVEFRDSVFSMEDGELDFSNKEVFSSPNMGEIPSSGSMDSFFDELLKDTHACTHTHTCNLQVPIFNTLKDHRSSASKKRKGGSRAATAG